MQGRRSRPWPSGVRPMIGANFWHFWRALRISTIELCRFRRNDATFRATASRYLKLAQKFLSLSLSLPPRVSTALLYLFSILGVGGGGAFFPPDTL